MESTTVFFRIIASLLLLANLYFISERITQKWKIRRLKKERDFLTKQLNQARRIISQQPDRTRIRSLK